MGFGTRETPVGPEYTLSTHVDNLEALLLELDLDDITLVMQDWGGPIGGGFAFRHVDRVKRLCLINTIVPLGLPLKQELFPRNAETEWFRWVRSAHADGTLEQVLGNLGVTVLSVMKLLGFENSAVVDQTWLRAYGAHFGGTKQDLSGAVNFSLDFQRHVGDENRRTPASLEAIRRRPAMLAEGLRTAGDPAGNGPHGTFGRDSRPAQSSSCPTPGTSAKRMSPRFSLPSSSSFSS